MAASEIHQFAGLSFRQTEVHQSNHEKFELLSGKQAVGFTPVFVRPGKGML